MPLNLQIADLKSGMRLARPLIAGHKLVLPQGKVLTSADVDALLKRHPNLHAYVCDPLLDEAVAFEDDSQTRAVSDIARRRFVQTVQQAQSKFTAGTSLRGMDFRAIESAIAEIVSFLQENPIAWAVVGGEEAGSNEVSEHAGNAFYLSMVLGNAVRGCMANSERRPQYHFGQPTSRRVLELAPLGLAALLMDIALWPDYASLCHPGPLSPEERERVFRHPAVGAEMLPEATCSATVEAVRAHHENHDGAGYPEGLKGDDIPLLARILRIADAYSAATSERPYRQAKSSVSAFWEMTRGPYAELYDPVILKLFQAVVQPYPIGAVVQLACGRHAVVVRHGRRHGLLPEIVIAYDENNRPLPRKHLTGPYRLDEHAEHRILSFRGEDLSFIYGGDPVELDSDPLLPSQFATLAESEYP